jgi:hypothetical protein
MNAATGPLASNATATARRFRSMAADPAGPRSGAAKIEQRMSSQTRQYIDKLDKGYTTYNISRNNTEQYNLDILQ